MRNNKVSNGKGFNLSLHQLFFLFIFLFSLLSFIFLLMGYNSTEDGFVAPTQEIKNITIVLWDVKDSANHYGTFLGGQLDKGGGKHTKKCPLECIFTTDRSNIHMADAVVFDPTALDYDNWRRIPINMPHKQPYQLWVLAAYESPHNYPLVSNHVYRSFMDLRMTHEQNSDVPISLFCPWGESFKGPNDLLKPNNSKHKTKDIIFISSNCQFSGASARTAYVEELMQHINIDSYGECLHNKEWDKGKIGPSFLHMDEKIKLMSEYKIVLAFENSNVSDFVTEKVFNAFQAGSLPVYMGAPNIDEWLPGKDSILKTSEFPSPAALAVYLKKLLADEKEYAEYFEWKKEKLSPRFLEKYERCMYNSECRLCEAIKNKMPANSFAIKNTIAPKRHTKNYQAVAFSGQGDSVRVPHHTRLCVTDKYTLMAWVKPASFGDQRLIDKNKAGSISGFNFDIQAVGRAQVTQGFLRLCAGEGCYISKKGIVKDMWTHVAVVYSSEHPSVFQNHVDFYLNGVLDNSEVVFAPTRRETNYPLTFGKPSNERDTRSGFHGSMDSIAMFSTDLDAQQIRKYMFGVPLGDEEHLIGFWSFDDPPSASYAHDYGRFEYDGELDGVQRESSQEKPLWLNKCH